MAWKVDASMGESAYDWSNYVEYAVETDIGMRRANNQDSHTIVAASNAGLWERRGHFFMVADGMGAHAAGELASKMAVDGVAHRYHKSPESSAPEAILQAVLETNTEIFRRGHENNEFLHMGTTASMLSLLPQGAVIAHVGDSRVYRLRGTRLEQLTFDHSLVWELKKAGQLDDNSDLAHVVPKNVITRSLGPNANVQVDLEGPLAVHAGDVFLLCSDGLTGRIEDHELAGALANYSPKDAARLLINMANLRGGHDNITLIVARVMGDAGGTREELVQPITIGRKQPGSSVVPLAGMAVAISWLLALVFAATIGWTSALVAFLVGFAGLIGLRWYQSRLLGGGISLTEERKLGRAPYTQTECPSQSLFVQSLPGLLKGLRQSAEELNWVSQVPELNTLSERLNDACRHTRLDEALDLFAQAVSSLMQAVRKQQKKKGSDSSVLL